ncbi:MAG: GGDEF domain-containing protein [Candidatus Izimaplasma sp.]|nr:GGDEF domain-containing protein [Candidatus Izimaplasma bacterium]
MAYIVHFQIHIYALAVLLILICYMRMTSKIQSYSKTILYWIIIFSGIGILAEPLAFVFDKATFFGGYFLEVVTNMLIIIVPPIIIGLVFTYINYFIFRDRKKILQRKYYMHFAVVTGIGLIINFFEPIYFYIDPVTNGYEVGPFIAFHYILIGLSYILAVIFLVNYKAKIRQRTLYVFVIVLALPFVGMVLQLFETYLFLSWTSITLSILAIYVFLESTTGEKDYLSECYSRMSYEKYVKHLIEEAKLFSLLYIDLDNFKRFNDQYGHLMGDYIIKGFGDILKKAFPDNTFIARLGGDEFMVVTETKAERDDVITNIYQQLKLHQERLMKTLKFSYGWQTFESSMTIDEIYHTVDQKMYDYKRQNRDFSRREQDKKQNEEQGKK